MVVFKALQTYGDGTIVRWIEEPQADPSRRTRRPRLSVIGTGRSDLLSDTARPAGREENGHG
ncbi:DUF1775 domain-containing protein [Kitasatospora sp. NPDC059648]|uniref:DUF1775 domain-containing protein n=1 Tax=Kitasatospora sp. NPDC059648 TaxID=3346894 RepID=UPI0036B2565E